MDETDGVEAHTVQLSFRAWQLFYLTFPMVHGQAWAHSHSTWHTRSAMSI